MKKLSFILFSLIVSWSYGQNIKKVELKWDKCRDADFRILSDSSSPAYTNKGYFKNLYVSCWTWNGIDGKETFIIDFDFDDLPKNAVITSAILHLEENPEFDYYDNATLSPTLKISKVLEQWDENKVCIANMPKISTSEYIIVKQDENNFRNIDVTKLMQDKTKKHNKNYGLYVEINGNERYQGIVFGSKENLDPQLRPHLTVYYTTDKNDIKNTIKENTYLLLVYNSNNELTIETTIYDLDMYIQEIANLKKGKYLCIMLKDNKVKLSTVIDKK